jgi:hypothetical protein
LGWLAGIQHKRKTDKNFFARVCEEARKIAHDLTNRAKLPVDADEYSDGEVADRAVIRSDESSDEPTNTTPSQNRANELLPEPGSNGSHCSDQKGKRTEKRLLTETDSD